MNEFVLAGRIVKDVEKREKGGKSFAYITIAINSKYDTEFLDITVFNKLSEIAEKYCKQGKSVAISGHLSKSGKEHDYSMSLIGDKITLL